MRTAAFVMLACAAACSVTNLGFGVALTIDSDSTIDTATLQSITQLNIQSSGDEIRSSTIGVGAATFTRQEELVYRPISSARTIALMVSALDARGTVVATGTTTSLTLSPGNTTSATVMLTATNAKPDLGELDLANSELQRHDMGSGDLAGDMTIGTLTDAGCIKLTSGGPYFGPEFDEFDTKTGNDIVQVAVADLDGDHLPDILFTDRSGTLNVWHNDGARSFTPQSTRAVACNGTTGGYPSAITVGDFDGDGKLDAIVACSDITNTMTGVLSFMPDIGNAALKSATPLAHAATGPYSAVAIDVDQDKLTDYVVIDYGTGAASPGLSVYWGATAVFTAQAPTHFTVGAEPYTIATAPLGADTVPDFVIADYGATVGTGGYYVVRRSRVTGQSRMFAADAKLAAGSSSDSPTCVGLGHLDADPTYDLVAFESDGALQFAPVYTSLGRFSDFQTTFGNLSGNSANGGTPNAFGYAIGDLNCDGRDDAVLTHALSSGAIDAFDIWQSTSAGILTSVYSFNGGTNAADVSAAIGDFDGDHLNDVLLGVNGASTGSGFVLRFLWGLPKAP